MYVFECDEMIMEKSQLDVCACNTAENGKYWIQLYGTREGIFCSCRCAQNTRIARVRSIFVDDHRISAWHVRSNDFKIEFKMTFAAIYHLSL